MLAAAQGPDGLSLLLPAEPRSVPVCRRALRGLLAELEADADATWRVCLAVNEAVANAVVHAYREQPDLGGVVAVRATCWEGELVVVVGDDGCGLSPRDDSPGAGVGLLLMNELCDHVSVRRPPAGGTEVTMCFVLAGPAQATADPSAVQALSSGSTRAVGESGSTV